MSLSKGLLFIIPALALSVAHPALCWGQAQGSFQGTVLTSDHSPVSNFQIKATKPAATTGSYEATAKTDETGKFTLPNLPKGTYTIAVFPPDPTESAKPIQAIHNVELPAGAAVRAVNFTLDRMGYFRVRLVKSTGNLSGEVYVDGNPYGRDTLSKPLLTTVGMHKLTAKSDNCDKPEEKVHNIRPYDKESVEPPEGPSAQEITLKCLK